MNGSTQVPHGVLAAVLTPMRDDLEVDQPAFSAHCHRLLESGCHGLGVFGTTGEANSLSVEERLEALDALVADGVPAAALLPGVGACALPDAVRLSRRALELGVGGTLALPPFYYKDVSDEGLFRFFAELIERVADDRLQLFLYHYPPVAHVGFSVPLVERLIDAYPGVIAGTKESGGDADRIERLCRQFPQLAIFAGSERFLLDTLRWGGAGCISATCNVTSELAREVYDLHAAGRDSEADDKQAQLTAVRAELEAQPLIPTLKGLMAETDGTDSWRNLRPPLEHLATVGSGHARALRAD